MSDQRQGPELLPVNHVFSLTEVCCLCEVEEHRVVEIISHGVIDHPLQDRLQPADRQVPDLSFSHADLERLTRAVRLQREFEVQVENLALVLDLMDTITRQRQEIAVLTRQAGPL